MAGGITVRSTLGEGSTFTCSVELGLDDPTRLAGSDRVLAGRRMLVVHHQPVVAEALRRHLASWGAHVATTATVEEPAGDWALVLLGTAAAILDRLGHPVDVVGDGEQAVDAVLAGSYDLVLMDLHMPRLDGIGATRRIRMYRPGHRPRIIALTASATDESRRACVAAGM